MEYNQISTFLDKFKKTLFKKENTIFFISKTILKYTKFEIDPKKIKIKDGNIYIESTPVVKNEIFINKNKILTEIKSEIQDLVFRDIK